MPFEIQRLAGPVVVDAAPFGGLLTASLEAMEDWPGLAMLCSLVTVAVGSKGAEARMSVLRPPGLPPLNIGIIDFHRDLNL